jgi:hypothetical protein
VEERAARGIVSGGNASLEALLLLGSGFADELDVVRNQCRGPTA